MEDYRELIKKIREAKGIEKKPEEELISEFKKLKEKGKEEITEKKIEGKDVVEEKIEVGAPEEIYNSTVNIMNEIYKNIFGRKIEYPLKPIVQEIIGGISVYHSSMIRLAHNKPKENYVPYHVTNVSIISVAIGLHLELDYNELINLGIASLLHSVGRPIGIEKTIDGIKSIPKSKEEYIGSVSLVSGLPDVNERVIKIITEHHKRMAPSTYPTEYVIGDLNLPEKILIAVDVYSTMLHSPFLHIEHFPHTVMMWILENDGNLFEPNILKAMVDVIGVYPIGTKVRLSTNEIAIVMETKKEAILTPIVKVIKDYYGKDCEKILDLEKNTSINIEGVVEE